MNQAQLREILGKQSLFDRLDVRTLVIDLVRDMPRDEVEQLFMQKLPQLEESTLRDYFYMSRGS